jgi:hypothetical protein
MARAGSILAWRSSSHGEAEDYALRAVSATAALLVSMEPVCQFCKGKDVIRSETAVISLAGRFRPNRRDRCE